jgi:ElaB/YqjD/DUF883 family membrane-anchored ribosome-binding protein
MSAPDQKDPGLDSLKASARAAAARGEDLHAQIRELTKSAFAGGKLDMPRIREVTRSVLEGVSEGSGVHSGDATARVRQSLSAIEAAILQAAENSTLALREARGKASEFSGHDLRQTLDELRSLEHALKDAVADTAGAGRETLSEILSDFATHARHSGSAFREQLAEGLGELQKHLPQAGRETLRGGADAVGAGASLLAQVASGMLVGLGETLRTRHDAPGPDRHDDAEAD